MWHFVAAILLSATTASPDVTADAVATTLDGSTVAGRLESWADGEITLETTDGRRALPETDLLSVERLAPNAPAPSALSPMVELTDGTLLPIADYRVSDTRATLMLDRPTAIGDPVATVAAGQIAAVRLLPLDSELAKQWNEIRDLGLPGDVLVVIKRDGKSLDYVEGILGDISAKDVQFTMDGEPVGIARTKVAGVIYYRTDRQPKDASYCLLVGGNSLRIKASGVRLEDGVLHVTTSSGMRLTWPWDDFSLADFSAGKLLFLSDLEPASERWTPLVSLPAAAAVATEYGRPRRDRSAFGGPLAIRFQPDEASDAAREEIYKKGLALRSRTELEYRLPRGFRRFVATAGIEPSTSTGGNVRLSIRGDGRPLLETLVRGEASPLLIELDITGIKRLAIIVDYGENLDTGDWLNLCQARIIK